MAIPSRQSSARRTVEGKSSCLLNDKTLLMDLKGRSKHRIHSLWKVNQLLALEEMGWEKLN